MAGALGPTGVFCGDPVGQPVMHYGHGYIFFVEQGNAKFGEVIPDLTLLLKFASPNGFNWVGYGLPGDSGSGVMNVAGLAVGDLTHGIGVAGLPVPGLSFGTDMGGIFGLIGTSYKPRHRRRPRGELREPARPLDPTQREWGVLGRPARSAAEVGRKLSHTESRCSRRAPVSSSR